MRHKDLEGHTHTVNRCWCNYEDFYKNVYTKFLEIRRKRP